MSRRILVSDSKIIDLAAAADVFDGLDVTIERTDVTEPGELVEVVPGADALVVDSGTQVTRAVLAAADSLAVVGRSGIGVDNIDVAGAVDRGVAVVNVPDYCVEEVSTHALGLILACLRKLPQFDRAVKSGAWDWSVGEPIHRLRGSTVGLVAFGKIARRLAAKLDGFGVDVVAYDPYVDESEMAGAGVEKVTFETLLARSDAVSVHTPLTGETEEMFGEDAFRSMRQEAVFVNTSRGGVVDEDALIRALEGGEVAAAGLDVRRSEPPDPSPLSEMASVVLTPHVAWYSEDARLELNRSVAEDVARVLRGEQPRNPVDPEAGW